LSTLWPLVAAEVEELLLLDDDVVVVVEAVEVEGVLASVIGEGEGSPG
jgi:hypothetical protein